MAEVRLLFGKVEIDRWDSPFGFGGAYGRCFEGGISGHGDFDNEDGAGNGCSYEDFMIVKDIASELEYLAFSLKDMGNGYGYGNYGVASFNHYGVASGTGFCWIMENPLPPGFFDKDLISELEYLAEVCK